MTVTLAALGSFSIHDYTKWAAVALFLLFAFFVIILTLNLLIAIMGDAYTKLKESELVEGLYERAKLIVEHERLFVGWQTYCRYLHVAEAVAESEAGGLTHVWKDRSEDGSRSCAASCSKTTTIAKRNARLWRRRRRRSWSQCKQT